MYVDRSSCHTAVLFARQYFLFPSGILLLFYALEIHCILRAPIHIFMYVVASSSGS